MSVSSANPLVMSVVFGVYVATARLGFAKPGGRVLSDSSDAEVHMRFVPLMTDAPTVVYVSPSHMVALLPALTTVRGVIDMVSSSKTSSEHAPSACTVNRITASPAIFSADEGE